MCAYSGEVLDAAEAAARLEVLDATGGSNYILVTREFHGEPSGGDKEGGGGGGEEGGGGGGGGEEGGGSPASSAASEPRVRAIDPTYRGNVGRWLNHACDGGNLEAWVVRSAGDASSRVVFFTRRAVAAGEELRWRYGEPGGVGEPRELDGGEGERRGGDEGGRGGGDEDGGHEGGGGCERDTADGAGEGHTRPGPTLRPPRPPRPPRRRCTCATGGCTGFMPFDAAALG
jgi:hypothetical protein